MIDRKGFVFDIDGTILKDINSGLVPGVKKVFSCLKRKKIPYVFVTNTTSRTSEELADMIKSRGFELKSSDIITPVTAAQDYLCENNIDSVMIVSCKALEPLFSKKFRMSENPQAVILADDGSGISYSDINRAFEAVRKGAVLITLQKNKFYKRDGQMIVDLGFYAAGMEYISGKTALNTGKPSRLIFSAALNRLELSSLNEIAIVGDDIEFDVIEPMKAGVFGVLVRTGKYEKGVEKMFEKSPNLTIDSIAELPEYL